MKESKRLLSFFFDYMKYLISLFLVVPVFYGYSQNTVGLIQFQKDQVQEGYNIIYPNNQSSVYLLDNCGQIVNIWMDEQNGRPGITADILPDGRLLRTSTNGIDVENSFGAGGAGGVIDLLNWDGQIVWQGVVADSINRQHHEAMVMPNGNLLLIVWEKHFLDDIVDNGFDTLNNNQRILWSDSIWEIDIETDSIVWKWNSWDHIVQDFDSTKSNFGNVSLEVGKMDINYQKHSAGRQDFMHCNSIDYNEELDQILISNRNYNELWIIDHGLTIEEAASSKGDILFRWGNPEAYKQGSEDDQLCFRQHNAHWVDDFVDDESLYKNSIVFFNNFIELDLSLGHIIDPVWNEVEAEYQSINGLYFPENYSFEFSHPDTSKNYSTAASSIQILDNDHVLMHAGRQGRAFELNTQGEVVWEYVVPIRNGFPVTQGSELSLSQNFTFQLKRYPPDYSGFDNTDLNPKGYLELNPNEDFCNIYTSVDNHNTTFFSFYPNPTSTSLTIIALEKGSLDIYDTLGRIKVSRNIFKGENLIQFSDINPGVYFIRINGHVEQFVISN